MAVRYRRSRHLVCHWAGGRLILVNYATNVATSGEGSIAQFLSLCDDWLSQAELEKALPSMPRPALRTLLRLLVDRTLLARSDRPEDPRDAALASWESWNPAAGFFHFTTKDVLPPPDLESA